MLQLVDTVVVAMQPEWASRWKHFYERNERVVFTDSGATRQMSVWNGLKTLEGQSVDTVAIHDAARPCFTVNLLNKLLELAENKGSAIPIIYSPNALAVVEDGKIKEYISRESVSMIQTPQIFKYDSIFQAHSQATRDGETTFLDDSQIFKTYSGDVFTTEGEFTNLKITYNADFRQAEMILKESIFGIRGMK